MNRSALNDSMQFLNERYKDLVESTGDWLWEVDEHMRFTYCSPQVKQILRRSPDELIGELRWGYMPQQEARRLDEICRPQIMARQPLSLIEYYVEPVLGQDRVYIESTARPYFDSEGKFRGYRGIDREISCRKKLEKQKQHYVDVLGQIEEAALILDKEGRITFQNSRFSKIFGYSPEEIFNKSISLLDAKKKGSLETGNVLEELIRDGSWEGETRRLAKSGKPIPVYLRAKTLEDEDNNLIGFIGTYFDLTPYKKSEKVLRKTLRSTIKAISITVEKRDPYTYGHQQRMANLCVKIAKELGKDSGFIKGLEMGALIHDIGKIHIPGEILNRPGNLTEHEMGMIRTHPKVGNEVVKGLEFPWPIAAMILQHHERLDGSGYPEGRINGDIIPEARIIAVADVLEAMTTHRPYRPAQDISIGLKELQDHCRTHYEPDVVDACLKICAKKSFSFD